MPASDPSHCSDRVEELLADVVTLSDAEQPAALDRLCTDHPQLAAQLRQRFALFLRIAAPSAPATPRQFGDYTLLRELGRGGMGVVHLASQRRGTQERLVALKLVRDRLALSPQARERLQREGAAAFRLDHPGICQAFDVGEIDGTAFVAMRYVPGRTLAALLAEAKAEHRQVTLHGDAGDDGAHSTGALQSTSGRRRNILLLIEQVARALHAAHEAGFVHRDVKPGNIMVGNDGAPVVLDFGLVHDVSTSHGLTLTDQPLGTPNYMSPEQIAPRGRRVDRTTDIYSLGVTLYELLANELPFTAANREELFQQILTAAPPRLSRKAPGISRDLEVVVHTALDKDPGRRYQTALNFAEDLRNARMAQPIIARPPSVVRRLSLWTRRNPLAAIMLGLLAVSQVLIVLLALSAHERAADAETARRQAEQNYLAASDAIEDLGNVASEQLADIPWLVPVRRELFHKVLEFHERAAARPRDDDASRLRAARAWVRSAHLHEDLGESVRADALLDEALRLLAAATPTAESLRWTISATLLRANLAQKRGDASAAEAALQTSIADSNRLLEQHAGDDQDRLRLGTAQLELAELIGEIVGRRDDAAQAIEACLGICGASATESGRMDAAAALRMRARFARRDGDQVAPLRDLERGVTLLREIVASKPHGRTAKANLANALLSQGLALKELRQDDLARACYAESRHAYEDLVAAFPFHVHYRVNLARVHSNLAVLQRLTRDTQAADASLQRALELGREALRMDPASTFTKSVLADSSYNLANLHMRNDPARAKGLYIESLEYADDLLRNNPDHLSWLELASRANNSIGALHATEQQFEAALTAFQRGRQMMDRLLASQQPTPRLLRSAATLDYNTGSLVCETGGDLGAAIACLRSAAERAEQALLGNLDDPRAHGLLLNHRVRLAVLTEMQDVAASEPIWRAIHDHEASLEAAMQAQLRADLNGRFDLACGARGFAAAAIARDDAGAAAAAAKHAADLMPSDEKVVNLVERLLLCQVQLRLAQTDGDVVRAQVAATQLGDIAARLAGRLHSNPLHRRRLQHLLPSVISALEQHGDRAPLAAIEALSREAQ